MHAYVGYSEFVIFRHRSVKSLEEQFLDSLIRAHAPFKTDESKHGFDMPRCNLVCKVLVQKASFGQLGLLFFEHCVLNHKLDQVTHVERTCARSSALELCPCKGHILERVLDEVDVAEPELKIKV